MIILNHLDHKTYRVQKAHFDTRQDLIKVDYYDDNMYIKSLRKTDFTVLDPKLRTETNQVLIDQTIIHKMIELLSQDGIGSKDKVRTILLQIK